MDWTKQGTAVTGSLALTTGERARVVIVDARENPKGAVIVTTGAGGVETKPLESQLDRLSPAAVAEILCVQERLFGSSGLPKVKLP